MYKSRAKQLRKISTDAERILWRHLRSRQIVGYKFRRQEALGPYIVDFVCIDKKLVIELDGRQHMEQVEAEAKRAKWLEDNDFKVVRFWDNQVLNEPDAVKQVIMNELVS